jgi:hypothetical protein
MPTLIPPSRRRLSDVAREAYAAGAALYTDGRSIVAAPTHPGGHWTRLAVPKRVRS